jgi:creatinine amidohydrolase/Fe(II)-dependent formamide hydrolase-like protein
VSESWRRLEDFVVLDRLEVGPVRIGTRSLVAPYSIEKDGRRLATEVRATWEEDVFRPGDASDLNLATLVAAQVALNYTLFCRELVFRGPLEEADRKFLDRMAENTAREIYVNKLLAANPFLLPGARDLSPQKRDRFGQASLVFPDEPAKLRAEPWSDDSSRHAILSSGGKDSLLTFGLLREIGRETHPIFVNEAGRHWYTALNAYRHFRRTVPQTARVWTNADRVFTWMLRQLPFFRSDFARVRADIYPVRLWTVAVFVFAALPLLRSRRVGRLLIGDEFDTTVRLTKHGITHYDGLYDQSRWFDQALTRLYHRKGWLVNQFSILRPLSELLIEKILAERYPDLQRQQVSCHAAHLAGSRALPCGRCEKCRRIVGMLTALDADPRGCGYTDKQVARSLADLHTQPLKQESAGAEHLAAMLSAKGLLPVGTRTREHPEILKVRIDPEKSPLESVPLDLRRPVLEIFLQHAQGAARRQGRVWIDFPVLDDPELHRPYPFEGRTGRPAAGGGAARPAPATRDPDASDAPRLGKRRHILGELTWLEARERFKEVDVALLPVGALEQHGPHLPLDTDAFDAQYLAQQVAAACRDPKPLVLPLVPYGVSYHHEDFPGTLSVSNDALGRYVYDIGMSAARSGVTKLVIVNGHGGNTPTLQFAAQMINRDAHIFTCVDTGETSEPDVQSIAETSNDVHAGEIETSTTIAVRPELVDMRLARRFVRRFSSAYLEFSGKRSVEWYARTRKLSRDGVLGDPTKASAEKGRRMWDIMIRNLVELVEDLKRLTLNQIYERRY